jgi:hypothetical protein
VSLLDHTFKPEPVRRLEVITGTASSSVLGGLQIPHCRGDACSQGGRFGCCAAAWADAAAVVYVASASAPAGRGPGEADLLGRHGRVSLRQAAGGRQVPLAKYAGWRDAVVGCGALGVVGGAGLEACSRSPGDAGDAAGMIAAQ